MTKVVFRWTYKPIDSSLQDNTVKYKLLSLGIALAMAGQMPLISSAQTAPPAAQTLESVVVTGSRIKRIAAEGALPVQIITRTELDKQGIVTAEQLINSVTANGNGADNLASNSDVGAGSSRGNNGLSAANLRGQGSQATLVLLNGRRLAGHALNGNVVDLNSIPMAAVQRVEVLKDGASAIYGADAVGGVINFILRQDFNGIEVSGSADITQKGGGNIYRGSVVGGFGSLETNGFNITGTLGYSKSDLLKGSQRDFVNTFQPDRGLSPDTRGAPFATAFAITSTRSILSSRTAPGAAISNGTGPLFGNAGTQRYNGINALDLAGQPGCASIDGMSAYDELIWDTPAAKYGCAWDTGRAAALQQPVENISGVLRGVFKITNNLNLVGEYVGGNVTSRKVFSNNQISSSNATTSPFYRLLYPSTGSAYNSVFNAIVAQFPSIEENRGQGIAFRWRCMACGPREIETESKTARFLFAAEGTFGAWDYRTGYSKSTSNVTSTLGGGYYFNDKFVPLLASGTLNPFLRAGETQTAAALDALAAASATGVSLYGGKTSVDQLDFSVSGPIAKLGNNDIMLAAGIDRRIEKFSFNGETSGPTIQSNVFNAPFDGVNTLNGAKRTVNALFGEVLVPFSKAFEVTAAVRYDRYNGFGATTNPKVSFKFAPVDQFLVRGSYNSSFRVPGFKDLYFGITQSDYSGKDLVDPAKCAALIVSSTPGCEAITPTILSGGKPSLQPEKAKQGTLGFVVAPTNSFSFNVDYWQINKTNGISFLDLQTLNKNYALFQDLYVRNAAGNVVSIDGRAVNAGGVNTKGLELGVKFADKVGAGRLTASIDGTYMISRKSKLLPGTEFGENQVGKFIREGDIPLRWKHVAQLGYSMGGWGATLYQRYFAGYKDNVAPGVENGTVTPINFQENVKPFLVHVLTITYSGIKNLELNFGIKNLLNKAPPFSVVYDSDTGAGSSWEPRVADPRLRAFLLSGTYRF
jgi:iron complex outermembrane recepter protein